MPRPTKRERSSAMYETILKLQSVDECIHFLRISVRQPN